MVQLMVYRADALVGELDLRENAVEIGDREGDGVRWDELGLTASPGWGGRLERSGDAWVFAPRPSGGADAMPSEPVVVEPGARLEIGDGSLEVIDVGDATVVDVQSMPDDGAQPFGVEALRPEPGSSGDRLQLLADFVKDIETGTSEEVLQRALDEAFRLVGCERGIAALRADDASGLRVVSSRNFEQDDPQRALSRRVLDTVLKEGRDVFTSNAPVDIPTVSVNLQEIRAICALPLRVQGKIAGVLYVDRGALGSPFSSEDLAFLQLLAVLVARRLEQDVRLQESENERRRLAGKLAKHEAGDERDLAWNSPAMQRVSAEAQRLLRAFHGRSLPVLVTGESGTGKEVLARWLHNHLDGDAGPFVAVNCAAIPHDLAESELFGIEQGVASGVMRRVGKFQQANGGTLFLDEIGEMDLSIQSKVLRALESRKILRVGGQKELSVDLRIISATNISLEQAIKDGVFREDLYWRLNGVTVRMPPLRERREDIPDLCAIFARHFAADFGLPVPTFEREALARLVAYNWPGNVRELKQRMGALTAMAATGTIGLDDLPPEVTSPAAAPAAASSEHSSSDAPLRTLADLELEHIRKVLDATGGDRAQAADILGIHKKTLGRKLASEE